MAPQFPETPHAPPPPLDSGEVAHFILRVNPDPVSWCKKGTDSPSLRRVQWQGRPAVWGGHGQSSGVVTELCVSGFNEVLSLLDSGEFVSSWVVLR